MKFIYRFLAITMLLIISVNNVNAYNYEMTLNSDSTSYDKNSNVDIFINLKNISILDGLNVCEAKLVYNGDKITVNSITGANGWNVTTGEKLIFDNSSNVTNDMNIGKISITLKEATSLTLSDINCTDGEDEYSTSDYSYELLVKESTTTTNVSDTQNENVSSSSSYKSSATVDNEQTGVKEYCLLFVIILFISYLIYRLIKKNDIFKKV